MNIAEGTRRLSLAVGLVGAVLMTLLEPMDLAAIHNGYLRRQRFDEMMRLPAMQRIAVEISKRPTEPANTRIETLAAAVRTNCTLPSDVAGELQQLISNATTSEDSDILWDIDLSKPNVIPIYRDGIATIELNHVGKITGIVTADGQRGDIVSEDWYSECIGQLMWPLFGFLVPWGLVRGLAWVIVGFRKQPRE